MFIPRCFYMSLPSHSIFALPIPLPVRYIFVCLCTAGSRHKHLGVVCGRLGARMHCDLVPALPSWRVCARVCITNPGTFMCELLGCSPSEAYTHASCRSMGSNTHTHTSVCSEGYPRLRTQTPPPLSPRCFLLASPQWPWTPRVWAVSPSLELSVLAPHSCPSPHPNAQIASWRNKYLWMGRASPTPETPARSAGVRKAKPVASLGPAPGPLVPTRCLVPAARTTATVRCMRWGGGGSPGMAWPHLGAFRARWAAYPGRSGAPPRPIAAPSPRLCLWRERVP